MGNSVYRSMSVDIPEHAPLLKHRKEEEERKRKQANTSLSFQSLCCKERELSRDNEVIAIKCKNWYESV